MRYLTRYKIYEDKQDDDDIDSICRKHGITNYTINSDGTIDVDGDVDLYNRQLVKLPLKFGKVSGSFYCFGNKLTSLEGAPDKVGGHFNCYNNQLTSLKHCPSEVDGDFNCSENKLVSLEHSPSEIGGRFNCSFNKLTSLEHYPSKVGGHFTCSYNPIDTIVYPFKNYNNLIELFNDTDIVQGDKVIYDRLTWFYEEIEVFLPDIKEIEKYYTIVR